MILSSQDAPTFRQAGVTAVGYAAPSRGAAELSVWRVTLDPRVSSPLHALSREEVFLALRGSAIATLGGVEHALDAGDCLVVPPSVPFRLAAGDDGLEAVCAMAAGGQATMLPDGPTLTPAWAA